MNFSRLKNEGWLYGLAFLVAIGFRMIDLGASRLQIQRRRWPCRLCTLRRARLPAGPQPGYYPPDQRFVCHHRKYELYGALRPGSCRKLACFCPFPFREKIKPLPALILAFFLPWIPDSWLFRVMPVGHPGSDLPAPAWGMWRNQRTVAAGIFSVSRFSPDLPSGPDY
jgi:hypothetical protein